MKIRIGVVDFLLVLILKCVQYLDVKRATKDSGKPLPPQALVARFTQMDPPWLNREEENQSVLT